MITKESLGIFWENIDGFEEVEGLYFYGFWKNILPDRLEIYEVKNIWKSGEIEVNLSKIEGEEYSVYLSLIHISEPTRPY